jgi:hypothetical protein
MKVIVHIAVKIPFEISDGGYLGSKNSSINDHINAAKNKVGRMQVGVKKSPSDETFEPVKATLSVEKVELIP